MRAGEEVTFLWKGHVVSGIVTSYSSLLNAAFIRSPEVDDDRIMVWAESLLTTEEEVN